MCWRPHSRGKSGTDRCKTRVRMLELTSNDKFSGRKCESKVLRVYNSRAPVAAKFICETYNSTHCIFCYRLLHASCLIIFHGWSSSSILYLGKITPKSRLNLK